MRGVEAFADAALIDLALATLTARRATVLRNIAAFSHRPRSVVLEVFTSATGGLALTQTEVALVPCRFADAPLLDAAAIWLIGAQRPDATFGCS